MVSLGLKIAMVIIMAVQLLAIGYAAHLVRKTKYSIIWILCIVSCLFCQSTRPVHK